MLSSWRSLGHCCHFQTRLFSRLTTIPYWGWLSAIFKWKASPYKKAVLLKLQVCIWQLCLIIICIYTVKIFKTKFFRLCAYNHWSRLDWTTRHPLKLKLQHYNSILVVIISLTYVRCNTSVFNVAYPLHMLCIVAVHWMFNLNI